MSRSCSSGRCQAALNQMKYRETLLARGDFFGALGFRPCPTPVEVREETVLSLCREPTILADGARMWKF